MISRNNYFRYIGKVKDYAKSSTLPFLIYKNASQKNLLAGCAGIFKSIEFAIMEAVPEAGFRPAFIIILQ